VEPEGFFCFPGEFQFFITVFRLQMFLSQDNSDNEDVHDGEAHGRKCCAKCGVNGESKPSILSFNKIADEPKNGLGRHGKYVGGYVGFHKDVHD
jgi:hypothetical protein